MSLWAIVPVKPLRRGKSRLSGVLTEEERTFLNYTMLANTLKALAATPEIAHVLVVSRDSGALALARDFNAKTLQEDGDSDNLNNALTRATVMAQIQGARTVLMLPDDLPLLTPETIQAMIHQASKPNMVLVAPDRRRDGTNGLLITPPDLLKYQFGPGSFTRHMEQAKLHPGARFEVCDLPELALDLDSPEDLKLLRTMNVQFDIQGAD